MAETDIESVLREIRERVIAEQRAAQASLPAPLGSVGNGAGESDGQEMSRPRSETITEEHLSLISSYLTTTARAWDRLPPLVSNRSGGAASLELWLKRQLKRATRWFTWEQVNFNAAAHHALRDLQPILSAHAQDLADLRAQIERWAEAQQVANEQQRTDLSAQRADLKTQQQVIDEQRAQVSARIVDLVSEFREGLVSLQEEQRVSFRQLALETSEAAQLEDRARRKTETLLTELQRRIDQLEASK